MSFRAAGEVGAIGAGREPEQEDDEAADRTDGSVEVNPEQANCAAWGIVGRVVTVNCNNKAVIDFQDGG